jgi:hypothetical protein
LLLWLLATLWPGAAWAAPTMRVETPVGAFHRDLPFSFTVTLTNDGPPTDVVVSLLREMFRNEATPVRQSVHLPTHARKTLCLLSPVLGYASGLRVVLSDEAGHEISREELHENRGGFDAFTFIVLSEQAAGLDFVLGYKAAIARAVLGKRAYPNATVGINYASADSAPDHWGAYADAGMIVLIHPLRVHLSTAQQDALLDWVASGGTLLVVPSGEAGELATARWQQALPARLAGSVDMRSLQGSGAEAGNFASNAARLQQATPFSREHRAAQLRRGSLAAGAPLRRRRDGIGHLRSDESQTADRCRFAAMVGGAGAAGASNRRPPPHQQPQFERGQ